MLVLYVPLLDRLRERAGRHDDTRLLPCARRLRIRKWMTAAAQLPEAVFAVAYGMARTPGSAALAYSGRKIHFGRKTFGEFKEAFQAS